MAFSLCRSLQFPTQSNAQTNARVTNTHSRGLHRTISRSFGMCTSRESVRARRIVCMSLEPLGVIDVLSSSVSTMVASAPQNVSSVESRTCARVINNLLLTHMLRGIQS
eukprot:280979-Pyramimonas_sp.AAC.1